MLIEKWTHTTSPQIGGTHTVLLNSSATTLLFSSTNTAMFPEAQATAMLQIIHLMLKGKHNVGFDKYFKISQHTFIYTTIKIANMVGYFKSCPFNF